MNKQKQHYVPKVYLKRFSINKAGDLFTVKVRNTNSRIRQLNASQICYGPNYYRLKKVAGLPPRGSDPNLIEKAVFTYEDNLLVELFAMIDHRKVMNRTQLSQLLEIIFSIKRRNPAFKAFFNLDAVRKFAPREFAKIRKEMNEKYPDKKEMTEEMVRIIEKQIANEEYAHELYKNILIDVKDGRIGDEAKRIESMVDLHFTVYHAKYETPFITSDNPGYTIGQGNKVFNLNLNYIEEFVFPVSPLSLLHIDLKKREPYQLLTRRLHHKEATPYDIAKFNLGTALNCNERVISHLSDTLYVVREHYNKNSDA